MLQCFTNASHAHLGVHLALHFAALRRSTARVQHDLGVRATGKDEADGPLGVSQNGTSEKHIVQSDRDSKVLACGILTTVEEVDGGAIFEHVDTGRITFDGKLSARAVGGFANLGQLGDCLSGLEVGLAIKVLRLDVRNILFFGGRAKNNVFKVSVSSG